MRYENDKKKWAKTKDGKKNKRIFFKRKEKNCELESNKQLEKR